MTGTRLSLFALLLLVGLAAVSVPADPKPPIGDSVESLVARLGDPLYAERERAVAALVASGEAALAALRAAADTCPNPEIRWRARQTWNRIALAAGVSKSTGMTLLLILPGEFEMGSPPREPGRRADEQLHTVRITHRFLVGVHEVTQAEYKAVTDAEPSWFSLAGGGKDNVSGAKTDPFAVETVTWYDAVAFCNALSAKDGYKEYYALTDAKRENGALVSATVKRAGGNGYRLPTEAEWEYACRAGTATPFAFGRSSRGREGNFKTITFGGYGGDTEVPSKGRVTAVGEYKPNRWGLHDTHGNVGEWCDDWHDPVYYPKSPADNPPGPETGTHKAVRGGNWLVTDTSCRSASRYPLRPEDRSNTIGFRVARTP